MKVLTILWIIALALAGWVVAERFSQWEAEGVLVKSIQKESQ